MNHSMIKENDQQMRKAAILIASLDEALADRMLAEMPTSAARAVREMIERLGEVDAEEARDIVDQFRQDSYSTVPHDSQGVELDASLLARIEQHDDSDFEKPIEKDRNLLADFTDAEAATIVDALSCEHPQTVAVVISRLDQVAAARILSLLSPNLQVEVLERVAEHDLADVQSLYVVESHLAQWINQKRQRTERMAAGAELAQRILQETPEKDRAAILGRLESRNSRLAKRIGSPEKSARPATETLSSRPKISREQFRQSARRRLATKINAVAESQQLAKPQQAPLANALDELEKCDDATLLGALTQTDRQIVTLALAGASEELMKRILRRLPRREAKEFRKRLRDIGPTRLSDMLAAQQQLAENARQLN